AECREAVRLRPGYAEAHNDLGVVLNDLGRPEEAAAECREAVRLRPDLAEAHYNLGKAMRGLGRPEEAAAEDRGAVRLRPGYAEAHCNLGSALADLGLYADAVVAIRKGHELGSRRPNWPYPSQEWLEQAERLAALAARLPGLLRGEDQAEDNAERL